jgi:DMSO/TMAO reductase YedYZ heme-binding membrane subunit
MTTIILNHLGVFITPFIFLIIYYLRKYIFHYQVYVRTLIILLAGLSLLIKSSFLDKLIIEGHLGLSFFIIVIFLGVLNKNHMIKKQLTSIRGELALFGFIFLIPHGIERLRLALTGYQFTGLIAMIIFIPLLFTSFISIRKKMKPKHWKQLHKFAYAAYLFIYIHLGFMISINPNNPFIRIQYSAYVYHTLFLLYIALKIKLLTGKK